MHYPGLQAWEKQEMKYRALARNNKGYGISEDMDSLGLATKNREPL
jgi:hypothetical protein